MRRAFRNAFRRDRWLPIRLSAVKATLYDGSYHPVDSSEMAFKMATILAFKKGFMDASPVLLEPIVSMKVTVPDKYTGDVMGDLNKRRGRVLGMNPDHEGNTVIEADVPQLEIYGYSTDLRSMTGGSGEFSYEFARYEQAPAEDPEERDRSESCQRRGRGGLNPYVQAALKPGSVQKIPGSEYAKK